MDQTSVCQALHILKGNQPVHLKEKKTGHNIVTVKFLMFYEFFVKHVQYNTTVVETHSLNYQSFDTF